MRRRQRAVQTARRLWPYVLMAWERWQALPEADKARYRKRAREAADRGRDAAKRGRKALEERRPRRER